MATPFSVLNHRDNTDVTVDVCGLRQLQPPARKLWSAAFLVDSPSGVEKPPVRRMIRSATICWHIACFWNKQEPLPLSGRGVSWKRSLPNSRATGSPASRRTWNTRETIAVMTTRTRNRPPWKRWPIASPQRAAFFKAFAGPRNSSACPHEAGRWSLDPLKSPLPAQFLPAGFFLFFSRCSRIRGSPHSDRDGRLDCRMRFVADEREILEGVLGD